MPPGSPFQKSAGTWRKPSRGPMAGGERLVADGSDRGTGPAGLRPQAQPGAGSGRPRKAWQRSVVICAPLWHICH